jgi:hypothetical protein
VRDAVGGAVRGAVAKKIRKAVADVIGKAWPYYLGGQFWPGGWYWGPAFTSFFREVCGLALQGELWERGKAYEATVESACWWYPHRDFVMVCERPVSIQRELTNPNRQRGPGSHRLHNPKGPAVVWPDGWGVYAVHGVRVPWWVVMRPDAITVHVIEAETNAEIKRVMIERYGESRYVLDTEMMPVARDERFGDLYVQGFQAGRPIAKICVTNRTAEPNGEFRKYWIDVNPQHYNGDAGRIPQAAVASTWRTTPGGSELFFKDWRDYRPAIET